MSERPEARPDACDPMPDIALERPKGSTVRPSDFVGRKLVVFFYPKDDTPGCTIQNIEFSQAKVQFDEAGVALLGVSKDSLEKHRTFTAKHDLTAPLASDVQDNGLAHVLGIWGEKSIYGRKYMGMERTTYLVDAAGTIAQVWRQVKVKGHVATVLEATMAL